MLHLTAIALLGTIQEGHAQEVELGGFAEANVNLGVRDGEFFDYANTAVLGLSADSDVNDNVTVHGALDLRVPASSFATTTEELGRRSNVQPVILRVDEAYVDLYAFGLKDLDVRVGNQRVIWGTADGFNPTSYLAPFDLRNPLDFKERLSVTALNAKYYAPHNFEFEAVVAPFFTPSLLPSGVFSSALPLDITDLAGDADVDVEIANVSDTVRLPKLRADNVQFAGKVSWSVIGVDLSASYFRGRTTIPVLTALDATVDITADPMLADVAAVVAFPKVQAVGMDMATSIAGIGFWAEGAVFFPTETRAPVTLAGLEVNPLTGEPLPVLTMVESTPYPKVVAGADYTFKGGYYINVQYLHGFFHEQTADALQDYALAVFRKKLFQDKLELQVSGGGEYDDDEHLGWMAGGELALIPYDSSRVTLGGLVARGDEGTTFNQFDGLEQVYLRFRTDF